MLSANEQRKTALIAAVLMESPADNMRQQQQQQTRAPAQPAATAPKAASKQGDAAVATDRETPDASQEPPGTGAQQQQQTTARAQPATAAHKAAEDIAGSDNVAGYALPAVTTLRQS